jgi:hypothetical protein
MDHLHQDLKFILFIHSKNLEKFIINFQLIINFLLNVNHP